MRGELVKLGFGKKLEEIDEYSDSDKKHSLIKGLYEKNIYDNKNIIDYKLKENKYSLNNIIKKPLNSDQYDSDKGLFGKPKIPTKIKPEEAYGQLDQLFPDANPDLLLALMLKKKDTKKYPYALLDSHK